MKNDYGIVKKSQGYAISSIKNEVVHFSASILTGKIMRKCWSDKVLALLISLAT